jgi:hypothetical protein
VHEAGLALSDLLLHSMLDTSGEGSSSAEGWLEEG